MLVMLVILKREPQHCCYIFRNGYRNKIFFHFRILNLEIAEQASHETVSALFGDAILTMPQRVYVSIGIKLKAPFMAMDSP